MPNDDIDALASALYNVSALRRELQHLAGMEHAVGPLTALGVVQRIGPARIGEVAVKLELGLSVVSRRIQVLEDEGFVDRVGDPDDRRCSLIAITPAGTAKLHAAHQRIVEALADALVDWDNGDVASLANGLVRLREALGSHESHRSALDGEVATERTSTSPHHTDVPQEEHSR